MNKKQKTKLVYGLIMAITGGLILFFNMQGAFGETIKLTSLSQYQHTNIAIEYSTTCIKLIELGDNETCGDPVLLKEAFVPMTLKPSFKKMFEDSSKTEATYYQQHNILLNHKKSCVKENYCNVFINPEVNYYFWYEPDQEIRGYYNQIITIHPNMKHKNINTVNQEVFDNGTSRTLILDTNQINIKSCYEIAYTPNNDRFLLELGGILWHILDDCRDYSKLGVLSEPFKQKLTKHELDITTSPNWQYEQELAELKLKYKEYRIGKD